MKLLFPFLAGLVIGAGIIYFIYKNNRKTSVFPSFRFTRDHSGPISFTQARNMHQDYLKWCLAAREDPKRILRYLRIDRTDLDNLLKNLSPTDGVRVYFGFKGENRLTPDFTTFIVGVDGSGTLRLQNANVNRGDATSDIIDNLPPCPDDCPGTDDFN